MRSLYIIIVLLFIDNIAFSQVNVAVDTTNIRIGEQIQYQLETENTQNVVFPKLQLDSLGKVEVVYDLPIDTIKNRLYKKYILTSFDSGAYQIPEQEVLINNRRYLTDSLLLNVGTVVVDTIKQKLFPIKPIFKAPPKSWKDYLHYLWWLLGLLGLVALVYWIGFRRRKAIKRKETIKLSPIEEALSHIKILDKKHLIEQQKIKEYYIELTEIVRNYIGKDVKIPTLEVTTEELITLLEIHNKSNKIGIDKERITQLHQFLQQADLVKFAKAEPGLAEIQEDRQSAEIIINDIQEVVHKPVLDDFGNEIIIETEEDIKANTSKKRRLIGVLIGLAFVLVMAIGTIAYYGFNYVKDSITGHPTKELLEGDWYHSSYGYPAVAIETPTVLKSMELALPEEAKQFMTSTASFTYGGFNSGFYILVNTIEYNPQITLDIESGVKGAVQMMKDQEGVSDLIYEAEDLTINKIDGKKLTGSMLYNGQQMLFTQYGFIHNQALQQIVLVRKTDDTYAQKIIERIEKSIRLQNINSNKEE